MNWNTLTSEIQLQQLTEHSFKKPQVIFKHSTRCGISSMVKTRLERTFQPANIDFYLLDLLAHRPLSFKVAEVFKTEHESPQILLIKNGICVYDESHSGINMTEIVEKSIH
ncbi:MAG TPA: bacillithiol system redox-active protein YtxJ [Chitinophagaceae bacterium]|jgi:bacillithiol system protein YtxJ|nr:bacillithiol system redox-active protein YtxJ [Chitinophagaceae bacterium]